jgi:hypothetical protein
MKSRLVPIVLASLAVLALSGCAEPHATVSDCALYYAKQGKDPEVSMTVCENLFSTKDQAELDRLYLPED